ncbi:MAG TPA: DUF4386 domain-containing protein [Phototrophicaceae bacterium]|nr:DUF4386 domain-containing protein [Phototrophicaceae bacterium]
MNTHRQAAITVGVLYIIGTVTGILSLTVTQSTLSDPDYLSTIAANPDQIVLGTLLWLTMGFALALVPVLLYPLLKKHNEVLALGYVVFRGALEPVAYILMAASRLLLILVSQQSLAAGASAAASFQSLGAFVLASHNALNPLLIITFSLDALMLYTMFYQSRLIPRWVSIWGFVAILLHLSTAFLILFRLVASDDMNTLMTINFPIFLQEMVMAVWLILRGFDAAVMAATSVPVRSNDLLASPAR